MKSYKYALGPALIGSMYASAAYAQQSVSEQFDTYSPPAVPDVEIVGHILKPKALEPTDERLNKLNIPAGFDINVFAEDLKNPRMLAVADDGSVYVTRRAVGDVVRLNDENNDGRADTQEIVANRPDMHGIAIDGDTMYLVTVNDIYRTTIQDDGSLAPLELLIDDLPEGGQHPNRTLIVGSDDMLYVSVGSTCNACGETNPENATILQVAPDGSSRTIHASGLRNTIGFGFVPGTDELYGFDHGIDWLGDNEQHEEFNRIIKGGNYGWPYIYGDDNANPADNPPGELTWADWAGASLEPVGYYTPHAAPMQMTFYTGEQFPEQYRGDAFIAMRGSWNRKPPSGYEVLRVDFNEGEPVAFAPFATGFLMKEDGEWGHVGRLAGVAQAKDGSLLVSNDEQGVIYRIAYTGGDDEPDTAPQDPTNAEGANVRLSDTVPAAPDGPNASQLAISMAPSEPETALNPQSTAFDDGAPIPEMFAAEQQNISPPLQWDAGPEGTKSYAVILQDPDVPMKVPFVHWVLYNIPADTTRLDKGVPPSPFLAKPEGARQGVNDRGSFGYFGPRPPKPDPAHHYHFQVFALDKELDLSVEATAGELMQAMEGHILSAGEIVGTYQR